MTRKIGNCTREVCFVLLIELSFEGGRVYRRTLTVAIIIVVHDKVLVHGASRGKLNTISAFGRQKSRAEARKNLTQYAVVKPRQRHQLRVTSST
jgi:hypothetical protein